MRTRTTVYLAIVLTSLLVLALAVLRNSDVDTQGTGVRIGDLDRLAREAKRRSESTADGGLSTVWPMHFESLEDAVAQHTIVLGVPVASLSRPKEDRNSVETWYKVRILETLSEKIRQPGAEHLADTLIHVEGAPAALLPVASGEILVVKAGGKIAIEGVEITREEAGFPDLVLNQTYLLFLKVESTEQVAEVPYRGRGVFGVSGQRDFSAIVAGDSGLAGELRNATGNELSRLRNLIRGRKSLE